MEQEIFKKITEQQEKIEKIYISVEKTRKYMLWIVIITIIAVVLPLIGLMFVIPAFISNYTSSFGL